MLGKIEGRTRRGRQRMNGWLASLTWWTWIWVGSGSWWWTAKAGMLQSMGLQSRTRPSDWTELMILLPYSELFWAFLFFFFRSLPSLVFPAWRSSFSICCKASLVVLNSLNFCLSGKLSISASNLNESLAGLSIFGCRFFSFITLNVSCHSLWLIEFLLRNQLIAWWEFPCMFLVASSLVAFNILSLS